MSFIESILNRRLGIKEDFIQSKILKKEIINPIQSETERSESAKPGLVQEVKPEPVQPVQEPVQPVPKRNPRGAGRKKITKEYKQAKKEETINQLTEGQKDLDVIKEIKESATPQEIKEEIKTTKKKLMLLSSSLNFIE